MNTKSDHAATSCGSIRKKTVIRNNKQYEYWEARLTVGHTSSGKQIQKSFSGKTKAEALEKMEAAAEAVKNGTYLQASTITLGQWLDMWLDEYCSGLKYQTRKHYRSACETHIKPSLGSIKLSSLSTPQIQRFYNELGATGCVKTRKDKESGCIITTTKPLTSKTIKNIHVVLSAALNTAVNIDYLTINPAARTKLSKTHKTEISPLNDEQVKAFLKELEHEEYAALFKVILFTGLRESEALGLTWDCIDFEKGILTIKKQLQKRPAKDGGYTFDTPKNNRTRYITAAPYVIQTLKEQREKQLQNNISISTTDKEPNPTVIHTQQLVFTTSVGKPINPKSVWTHYKKHAESIGVPNSRVHDLRHTYAVISLQNGDDIKTIQQNLGHATAAFTLDVYGHVSEMMNTASAKRMQCYIDRIQ